MPDPDARSTGRPEFKSLLSSRKDLAHVDSFVSGTQNYVPNVWSVITEVILDVREIVDEVFQRHRIN